jgi:phosphate-selective porin OprO and OprP
VGLPLAAPKSSTRHAAALALAVLLGCVARPATARAQSGDASGLPSPLGVIDPSAENGDSPSYLAPNPGPLPPTGEEPATPATPEWAADSAGETEASSPEMEAILQRLAAVEAELAAAKAAAEKPAGEEPKEDAEEKPKEEKPKEKDPLEGWTDMSTDKWTVKLGGHMQADFIHWADTAPTITDPSANDYFEFRRLRLLADGTGYGVYDFRIQIDIEPESGDGVATPVTDIKDAYFTLNELPGNHKWRIGNFFVPFSLEQVTNDTNNIFMERSIPTQGVFAADREVGMAVYGVNDAKDFTHTGGIFLDSISESLKERIDDNQGHRLSGRLTWLPYYDEPSNGRYLVHTGAGVLYTNDQDNSVRFRSRPQIHEGPFLIDSLGLSASAYTTANLEFALVWGEFSLQSEAFVSDVNMIGAPSETCYGSYVYGSWFLTGENRIYERFGQHGAQFARNVPFTNFFWIPGGVGWGGWEAKCRWSQLSLTDVSRGQYNDVTCGLNWYWSDRVRCMFDYIHPITDTVGGATPFGDTNSDIIAMRFDFNF